MTSAKSNQEIWADAYEAGYADSVMSVTPSSVLQHAVQAELRGLPFGSTVLIHGNGADDIIPSLVAQFANVSSVVCMDFPEVIERARLAGEASDSADAELRSKISYEGMDARLLGQERPEAFDCIIAINSIVAPSEAQNRQLLESCYAATKRKGILVGLFPTIDYSLNIIKTDLRDQPWKRFLMGMTVNAQAQTITSPSVGKQHFPNRLTLQSMIHDAGYGFPTISTLVLNDPAALRLQEQAYNKPISVGPFKVMGLNVGPIQIADFTDVAFSPVFENLAVAQKPVNDFEPFV